jgi:ABC-2 type transport system permease protein
MIGRIASHECRIIWRDHRFRWTAAMLAVLLVIAVAVSAQIFGRRSAATAAAQQAQREQWLHKSASNAHVAAHAGTTLFRPVHPLAVLDSGVDDVVGMSVFLEPHRRSPFLNASAEQSSAGAQFAELTAAFTLQTLVPLLVVLLTFPAFAAEREQGTLRHLLSLGVRPGDLALGKALGLTAPVLMLTIPAMIVGLLGLQARHPVDTSRGALLVLAYVVYVLLFIGLGLFVSGRSRTAQGALIALIGFWLIVSFFAPRAAFGLAQQLYPVPTAEELAAALERIDRAGNVGFLQQRATIERRLLAKYGVAKPTDLPVSTWGMTLYEREVESTERYNEEFARIFDTYERQQRFVDAVSIAVPPLALRTVSMALAGTDTAHYRHFAEAAEAYRYALVQAMNTVAIESRLYNSSPTLAEAPDQSAFPEGEAVAYERVGPFVYRTPSSQWALWNVGVPAGALLTWSVAIGLVLVWTVRSVPTD